MIESRRDEMCLKVWIRRRLKGERTTPLEYKIKMKGKWLSKREQIFKMQAEAASALQ
jgi:hypothetical protein